MTRDFQIYGTQARNAYHTLGSAEAREVAFHCALHVEEVLNKTDKANLDGMDVLLSMRDNHLQDALNFDRLAQSGNR